MISIGWLIKHIVIVTAHDQALLWNVKVLTVLLVLNELVDIPEWVRRIIIIINNQILPLKIHHGAWGSSLIVIFMLLVVFRIITQVYTYVCGMSMCVNVTWVRPWILRAIGAAHVGGATSKLAIVHWYSWVLTRVGEIYVRKPTTWVKHFLFLEALYVLISHRLHKLKLIKIVIRDILVVLDIEQRCIHSRL